jgi:hypothetical protein
MVQYKIGKTIAYPKYIDTFLFCFSIKICVFSRKKNNVKCQCILDMLYSSMDKKETHKKQDITIIIQTPSVGIAL